MKELKNINEAASYFLRTFHAILQHIKLIC